MNNFYFRLILFLFDNPLYYFKGGASIAKIIIVIVKIFVGNFNKSYHKTQT